MGRIVTLSGTRGTLLKKYFNKIMIMCVQDFNFYTITLRSHCVLVCVRLTGNQSCGILTL